MHLASASSALGAWFAPGRCTKRTPAQTVIIETNNDNNNNNNNNLLKFWARFGLTVYVEVRRIGRGHVRELTQGHQREYLHR